MVRIKLAPISLICYECKEEFEYSIEEKVCKGCGASILDEGIKELVFALNNIGVKTERSCEGHDDGNPWLSWHPWIAFFKSEDICRIEELIESYNEAVGYKEWVLRYYSSEKRWALVPKDINRRMKESVVLLAKFLLKEFG